MSSSLNAINYSHEHHKDFLEELISFLTIPSISTDDNSKDAIQQASEWIVKNMKKVGLKNINIFPTPGHPIVYGELLCAGPQIPTVLVYGHYDVQPVEPLDSWESLPFEPIIKGHHLYARGASDMKGQVLASLKAVESIIASSDLDLNVKFLIEGEEEIGSPNLAHFLEFHRDMLSCDVALNPDAGMIAPDVPTIVYGLRGLAYFEINIFGPNHDLHSGVFGGAVMNPAIALSTLLCGMHDKSGRVTLPGFYQDVKQLTEEERAEFLRLPMDDVYYLSQTGSPCLWGETGYSASERVGARPTLDINGLYSGYTSKGSKTIIPSKAMAKVSMRLVPDQDPDQIYEQLKSYMEINAPKEITWEIIKMASGPACKTNKDSKAANALANAMKEVWGVRPVYKREGGSVPIVADMQKILGIDSVLTGFGLPDDNIHSPNERLHLPTWKKGIDTLIKFFFNFRTSI